MKAKGEEGVQKPQKDVQGGEKRTPTQSK